MKVLIVKEFSHHWHGQINKRQVIGLNFILLKFKF